jgi:hypothetical protein
MSGFVDGFGQFISREPFLQVFCKIHKDLFLEV